MWQKTITLPEKFVFKNENLKTTIDVLVRLSNLWRKEIHIDFSRIKQVRKGDLMVLMTQLEKLTLKKKKIIFEKNIPYVASKYFKEKVYHQNNVKNAEIAQKVNPVIIANLLKDLSKLGINKKSENGFKFYERVNAFLIEIMDNAVEHGIRNRNLNYWLTSEIDKREKQMIITFVDMGKGIAYSHKKSKFRLRFLSDSDIVKRSLFGKLPSSTGKLSRGKGLPNIREIVEGFVVSNFILITNKSLIQYEDGNFTISKIANFKGTYYCCTINKQNFEEWKIS